MTDQTAKMPLNRAQLEATLADMETKTNKSRAERRAEARARRKIKTGKVQSELHEIESDDERLPSRLPRHFERALVNEAVLVEQQSRPGGVTLMRIERLDGLDTLTWDDLQWLKASAGFSHREAVEIYPRAGDVMGGAEGRFLWLFPSGAGMPFGIDPNRKDRGMPGPSV